MKIPFPKDEDTKGMMMSGSSTGRKELIHELRETSLIGGNAIQRRDMVDKAVQFGVNMDMGSGDTTDSIFGNKNNYDSFNEAFQFSAHVNLANEPPPIAKSYGGALPTPPSPSIPTLDKVTSSSESINRWPANDKLDSDRLFKGKEDSTLVVVEEGKQPNFRANESNPTVPSDSMRSETSTFRPSERPRSESEDDIEKMDDPDQDGPINDHKALYKPKVMAEDSQNSEKMDKNGNRSELEQNEVDNDCIVQCLYYTIQCCECVTF